jgi:tetratricopeptide (TPR) repeat protein
VILFGGIGAGTGYWQGINQRMAQQNEVALTEAATQFQYGLQQLDAGNYELARTHFEFVLKTYPAFPGIQEKYTEVMVKLAQSSAPTLAPQATPTFDNRGTEALFNQALQEVQSRQWSAAMQTLEAVRNSDVNYRTLEVDGLYFITLRHRAVEKITSEGELEEGLYFLALTERYAPLDHDAVNYATWARLYLTGASYWEVDWEQVVYYFSQLYAAFPNMFDGSKWTATERFMKGSEAYADQLLAEKQYCEAVQYYQYVLSISAIEEVQDKYNQAFIQCYPPTPTAPPPATPTTETTEEPTVEAPTVEAPTAEPTT